MNIWKVIKRKKQIKKLHEKWDRLGFTKGLKGKINEDLKGLFESEQCSSLRYMDFPFTSRENPTRK